MIQTTTALSAPPTVAKMGPRAGLSALKALGGGFGGILPILETVQREVGDVFQITLPGFRPVFVAHPDIMRQVLVDDRDAYLWRPADDPVARLLRHGLLVTDGQEHADLRTVMDPSSHRKHFVSRCESIWQESDRILDTWQPDASVDMLVEMRKLALIIFEQVYFSHDLGPELETIWRHMLKALAYIGPGLWVVKGAGAPPAEVAVLDEHLHALIRQRRVDPIPPDDLLTHLVQSLDDDDLVRDQMMTMLIAGHDTSTALLAWTLYLLGQHPQWMAQAQAEIRDVLGEQPPTPQNVGGLAVLDQVVKESLRLYPPIHVGNRFAAQDVELAGYHIPAGTRVMVSYYLVQRHPDFWEAPAEFRPERWAGGFRPAPFSYLPFGGGPRNCIGGAFAQLEARLVLARILQRFDLTGHGRKARAHMGATLEPHPGVPMRARRQA